MARDEPARKPGLVGRLPRFRWLAPHAGIYLVLNATFVAGWWLETSRGAGTPFWPGWLLLVLGLPLGLHGAVAFANRPSAALRQPLPQPQEPLGPGRARPGRAAADGQERRLTTVLFTDIVSSTERVGMVGDRRWGELLDTHDALARELVERFEGHLVKSTGDGILAVFDRPGRAIRCATALRDQLHGSAVDIRAGLHTGEVQFSGTDVGGIVVHIAARVMSSADAGEILVSRTVRDLVTGSDHVLDDRGPQRSRASPANGSCSRSRGDELRRVSARSGDPARRSCGHRCR